MSAAPPLANDDLRGALEEAWYSDREHVERMTFSAAIISTALDRSGLRATLVGGGALEFHVPDAYRTSDLDFVVERGTRETINDVFLSLGLRRSGRHWVRDDLFVEVPGNYMEEPADEVSVGPFTLRVITKEALLAERIVGFRYWKYWGHGTQAIEMLRGFGDSLDEEFLRNALRKEGANDALDLLRAISDSGETITLAALDRLWHLHYR
ncbi:hypothetical protein [Longimicrobium terrae]|uniref:Nucleotidyl transferase AbiEii/AbiGii toxin family protein n=1 Tax=Longimicrobium terrae TaxID=1639882 RepID=A0A841H733_9BACT|nr:hypothetical protein [Longimicrobium terrae]MBB4638185.1 hypothetical protein [Longimicrobium terrae]MBB6073656.1 hypothetical protein [Longimicrobium terrae]NNC30334.1 hypothetical protein [Longimicrobium terrae]